MIQEVSHFKKHHVIYANADLLIGHLGWYGHKFVLSSTCCGGWLGRTGVQHIGPLINWFGDLFGTWFVNHKSRFDSVGPNPEGGVFPDGNSLYDVSTVGRPVGVDRPLLVQSPPKAPLCPTHDGWPQKELSESSHSSKLLERWIVFRTIETSGNKMPWENHGPSYATEIHTVSLNAMEGQSGTIGVSQKHAGVWVSQPRRGAGAARRAKPAGGYVVLLTNCGEPLLDSTLVVHMDRLSSTGFGNPI